MTDYFALLDQPRRPWLDLEELKNSYHQKTLLTHPDAQASRISAESANTAFTRLNEAYQALQDPKRRLYHLLSLEGAAPSSDRMVPQHLHDLFPVVGALTQRANLLLDKIRTTSSRLGRSLLKPEVLEVQRATTEARARIQNLINTSLAELHQIDIVWAKDPREQIDALSNLYVVFAYLTRWSAQLDEITFQLSLH